MTEILITVDGACSNNGKPNAIASHSMAIDIVKNGVAEKEVPFTLSVGYGAGTENVPAGGFRKRVVAPDMRQTVQVAELVALYTALRYVMDLHIRCLSSGKEMPKVVIHQDSAYATDWALGNNKKLGVNGMLCSSVRELYLSVMNQVELKRVPREIIEARLGH